MAVLHLMQYINKLPYVYDQHVLLVMLVLRQIGLLYKYTIQFNNEKQLKIC